LKPLISLIVAAAEDGAIGRNNDMLWHLPDDFRWFKTKTLGHPIIMGRNTMNSLRKALPGRRNMVISSRDSDLLPDFEHYNSLDEALAAAALSDSGEIMIIGGGSVYALALNLADRVYLTRVHATFPDAEVFFHLPFEGWERQFAEFHPMDEKHAYPFTFEIWNRNLSAEKSNP
jgi:dihydrofolate reductase